MTDIVSLARSHALQSQPLQDLIVTRIYPVVAPENSQKPYVVYKLISDNNGPIQDTNRARIQFTVWPKTTSPTEPAAAPMYSNAHTIGRAIKKQFGEMVAGDTDICVRSARVENYRDTDYNPDNQHGVALDVVLIYSDT